MPLLSLVASIGQCALACTPVQVRLAFSKLRLDLVLSAPCGRFGRSSSQRHQCDPVEGCHCNDAR